MRCLLRELRWADNELVEIVQRHAKAKHNKNISREEIMKMAREA